MQGVNTIAYRKYTIYLLSAMALFRCIIAYVLPLGNDEAYYWLYNQKLYWNYFDHPPLVAVWTRLFTLNGLLPEGEFFLRVGSVAGGALATWFMYKTVALLHSNRAGFFAACLYSSSFYTGITAGIYLMPDAPQMVFWTFGLWMIARITRAEDNWTNWLLFGAAAGLCIMSKVHGLFLWGGVGLYILFFRRQWLAKTQLYVAALLTLAIISPIFFWNIKYDFVTFRFHSNRVIIDQAAIQFSFIKEALGQVYFNNPINFGVALWGLIALMQKKGTRLPALSIFTLIGLPLAGLLLFISFFRDTTLPHWSGPAYVSLLPLAAIQLASIKKGMVFPKLLRVGLGVFLIVLIGWACMVHFYPGTIGKQEKEALGKGDISLDLWGWKEAAKSFETIYKNEVRTGKAGAKTPLVCTYWWGAHIEYYFARPLQIPMFGLGTINQIRHYSWMNGIRKEPFNLDTAYCIMPVDEQYDLPLNYYSHIQLIAVIKVPRGGQPAHNFSVYRLWGWKGTLPIIK